MHCAAHDRGPMIPSAQAIHQSQKSHSRSSRASGVFHSIVVLSALLLCLSATAHADLIKVGKDDADYRTVAEAVTHALATPGGDQIRVQGKAPLVYAENLDIRLDATTGDLAISGGWDGTYTTRTDDASLTVLDGGGDRVVKVITEDGVVFSLSNLTMTNGGGVEQGAGLWIEAFDSSEIFVYDTVLTGNSVEAGAGRGLGGALYLYLSDSEAEVSGNRFVDNEARIPSPVPTSGAVFGGSVLAHLDYGSYLDIRDNLVERSSCASTELGTGEARGCGIYYYLQADAELSARRNTVVDTSVTGISSLAGAAVYLESYGSSPGLLEQNKIQGVSITDGAALSWAAVQLDIYDSSVITQRSSLFADSGQDGLSVNCNDTATWHGVNLTAAGNTTTGIFVNDDDGTAQLDLSNSISYGNSYSDLDGILASLAQSNNLIGVDPSFVKPEGGWYQLGPGSVALEAGTAAPPGGLSSDDLDGNDRVQGASVDIGAYEGVTVVFVDSFEDGNLDAWSSASP